MIDDFKPKAANDAIAVGAGRAPLFSDAEANRQMGRGEVPHPVAFLETAQEPARGQQELDTTAPGAPLGVQFGARSVARPTARLDESAGDEGTMYERLAKADNVPSKAGGSSLIG